MQIQQTESCIPAPSGMANWWSGDGNAHDIAGTLNETPENGAGFAPGKVDQAFAFNGSDYVNVSDNQHL